jgi:uncharacterized membrane protein
MAENANEPMEVETIVEMPRVGGLSDAVFAVALTLLVLDIRIPVTATLAELPTQMLELLPRLLVYLIGFIIIGGAWGSHQRMLGQIKRGDGPLAWLNLLSLLFVTLIPASASLLGQFPSSFLAIVTFAANTVAVQLSAFLLWRHAESRSLVNTRLDPRVISAVGRRLALSAIVFGFSVPLASLNPTIAYLVWIAWFIIVFTTDWLSWEDAYKTTHERFELEGATKARLRLTHAGGHLELSGADREGVLAEGVFGGGLQADVKRDDSTVDMSLRPAGKPGFMSARYPWAWSPVNSYDWEIGLTKRAAIGLDVTTAGGQAVLDLTELRAETLSIRTSATTLSIRLPRSSPHIDVEIEAALSSITIHIPEDVAADVRVDQRMASIELDEARFPPTKGGSVYRSPGYATATRRAEIRVKMGLGSIKLV